MKPVLRDDGRYYVNHPKAGWIEVEYLAVGVKPEPAKRAGFVMLPMFWVHQLARAKCASTLKLAHHLLDRRFRSKDKAAPIAVTDAGGRKAGIACRKQRIRALQELAQLGLITVSSRKSNQAPRVGLLHV
jgi:hypothetical protein